MTRAISDSTMSRLSDFLKREIGLVYPKERWGELERRMAQAARDFGFDDPGTCIGWLMSASLSRSQVETLAAFLTIGETYFYRDPHMLEVASAEILPAIVRSRRGRDQRLRIWSAGCSTGEEPYSVAILLHRLLPDISEWNITILATDINPTALRKGMTGEYGTWSFRGTPSWFKDLYFRQEPEERFRVVEEVRRLVSFEYLNLAQDSYPSLPTGTNAMDVIFCRNVLMYFDAETVGRVLEKLRRSLVEGGWLLVGAAETSPHGFPGYQTVTVQGVTCYRRKSGQQEVASPAPKEKPAPAAGEAEPVAAPQDVGPQDAAGSADLPPATVAPLAAASELYRKGEYREAAALIAGVDGKGEMTPEALALLIRAEANRGRLVEALAYCDEALSRNKLDPALHYLRAEILQERGQSAEAQLSLQRALYLDPDMVLAHFALGNLTLWGGKGGRAQRHFANALALLERFAAEEILPGSEGMTAGRLREIIRSMSDGLKKAGGGRQ